MVPEINLLPNLEKKKASPTLLYAVIIAITAIALAYMIFLYFGAKSDISTLSKQEQNLTTQRGELQQKLDATNNVNAGSLAQSVKFVENVSYPVTPLIAETQVLLPEHTYVRGYTFDDESVTVTIDFETMNDISKYVEKLGASNYFRDTQVDTIENFDVALGEQTDDKRLEDKFKEIPRYTVTTKLFIDYSYLARGGEG
ncbi:PilN domain-containing protein [Lysinibacillus sp. NPDC097287]|uniref:PilN domain-containing protein n=1 Tax=Lysinibacillus sp. NPDC097287 TaxID=3364144 RepID=UPI0037F1D643